MHHSREAIGARLQEERKRLGLNQDDFALQVGIAKRTLAGYEGGAGDVGAVVLSKASMLGVDVSYVVNGIYSSQNTDEITKQEHEIILSIRKLSIVDRDSVLRLINALLATST